MNIIESKIHLINERIISGYNRLEDVGVLNGASGLALFNYNYSRIFNLEDQNGYDILESCISKINGNYTKPTFCNGIIGLGWTINHLIKERFLDSNNNEILISFDKYSHYWMLTSLKENNIDFLHGAIGYANYLLDRYKYFTNINSEKSTDELIFMMLQQLKELIKEIELFSKGNEEINVKMSFENKIIFGLAHGISSIIFILNKISKISKFTKESLLLSEQYFLYLLKYMDKENTGISLFPNFLNSKGIIKYTSALSWCTGDLGIGINLLNTSIYYNQNQKYKQMGIEILKHASQRKTLEKSLIKTNCICHGYFGAYKIFSNAYKITQDKDFDETSKYWLNLGLESLSIKNDSDLSVLNGLSGIGLILLEVYSSRRLEWDSCFLLQ